VPCSVTVDGRVVNNVRGECIASAVVSVVNKIDRRRVLSTTRSTCCGEIFKIQDKVSDGSAVTFWRYPNFLTTRCGYVERSLHAQTSSICPVVSTQYQLMTDGIRQTLRERECAEDNNNDTVIFFLYGSQHFANFKPLQFPSAV